jgi:hypothetical protein
VLKGGFALDFRLGRHARGTRDLDLAFRDAAEAATAALLAAQSADLKESWSTSCSSNTTSACPPGGCARRSITIASPGRTTSADPLY